MAAKFKPNPIDPFATIPSDLLDPFLAKAKEVADRLGVPLTDGQLSQIAQSFNLETVWAQVSWPAVLEQLKQAVAAGKGPISSDPSALA